MNPDTIIGTYESWMADIENNIAKAFDTWGCSELTDKVRLEWNTRFRAKGADATFVFNNQSGIIRLSGLIWPHFTDQQRYETAVHEAAHIAAPYLILKNTGLRMRVGHGTSWKRLMYKMNLPANRCHTLDTDAVGLTRRSDFVYLCKCPDGVPVGPIRHKKIQSGQSTYRCVKCYSQLNNNVEFFAK